ncbi:hypothetical protein GCM10011578_091290 [Streptomyces fuscichromogenes]|uniref:Uncharacterized protein n=1 Tax=Streptomyces fuscichromogenes TaxID=1324013 RepID=A0A917XP12_9ACTN|nr:hypothetical protein GCM10011578_091290 [Streptomyces fuscichromogenes]
MVAEVARRSGSDILAGRSPEPVGEFCAGARLDLSVDQALAEAREWEPDMIVSEHCDCAGRRSSPPRSRCRPS